jgi:hypothetical protein
LERRHYAGKLPTGGRSGIMGFMDWLQPVLELGIRTVVGTLLSLALGALGVGAGWILFVFFGFTAHSSLLILMLAGAAVGAAAGGFLAWIRLDNNTLPLWVGTGIALLLAGGLGAWGGFRFGADQEVPCCAAPEVSPMTYMVVGAVAVSNGVALLLGIVHKVRRASTRRRTPSQGYLRR